MTEKSEQHDRGTGEKSAPSEGSRSGGSSARGGPSRKRTRLAIALALIPFAAMCFSVALWDRITPVVLGIPFNLFWLASWEVLCTVCLALAYRLQWAHKGEGGADGRRR